MPAITVDDIMVLPRLPRPDVTETQRPVRQIVTAARNAALTFSRQVVKRGGRNRVYEMLAKGYKDAERLKEAAHFYAQAVELSQADVVMLDYAEVLMALKKIDEAKAILEKAACENPVNRRRKEHMLSFVVPRVAAAE